MSSRLTAENDAAREEIVVRTRKEAAERLGVTDRTLGNWRNSQWWPAAAVGPAGWNVSLIAAAAEEQSRKGSSGSEDREQRTREAHENKMAILQEQRENLRRKNELQAGMLLKRTEVESFVTFLLAELSDLADTLPDELASAVAGEHAEQVRQITQERLADWRNRTADRLAKEFGEHIPDGDDDIEGAASQASASPAAD